MDKIAKFLNRLSLKQRAVILGLFEKIKNLDLKKMDIKEVRGYKNMYRARKGDIRILFYKDKANKKGIIVGIDYRKDVYKDL